MLSQSGILASRIADLTAHMALECCLRFWPGFRQSADSTVVDRVVGPSRGDYLLSPPERVLRPRYARAAAWHAKELRMAADSIMRSKAAIARLAIHAASAISLFFLMGSVERGYSGQSLVSTPVLRGGASA